MYSSPLFKYYIWYNWAGRRHPEATRQPAAGATTIRKCVVERWEQTETKQYEHHKEAEMETLGWRGTA